LVSLTRLIVVLLVVLAAMGRALLVSLRWMWRRRQERRLRRLEPEAGELMGRPPRLTAFQKWRERLEFAVGTLAMLCVAWGFVEPNWLEITCHRVVSSKLVPGTRIRVVHLSDMHSEGSVHLEPDVVARVAEQKPDLILFTGDAINEEQGLSNFRTAITALAKLAPTYTVRGNWETWWFPELDLYGGTGAHPIDGRAQAVTVRGQTLWLLGTGVDHEDAFAVARAQVPKGEFSVLLNHFPALAPRASRAGVDMMLAGDTHGGQSWLPGLGEVVRLARHGVWRSRGEHQEGGMWLYVNRGIGNEGGIPRFRFGCRPEISVISLEAP
jgi:uncharacterized protein